MKPQKIEYVMTPDCRDQITAIIGEHLLTKIGVPLLNLLNSMEQRAVPVEIEAPARSKRISGGAA